MRARMFNWERIGRAGALLLVAAAILGSAISIRLSDHQTRVAAPPAPSARSIDAGLERCRGLGTVAANDAQCQAVWAELRRRFFAAPASGERAP